MELRIERVVDDAGARAWHAVDAVVIPHEEPGLLADPLEELLAMLPDGTPSERVEYYVGYAGQRPVGAVAVWLAQLDNLHAAAVDLMVLPDERGRGHGRRLLAHAVEVARAHDRRTLMGTMPAPLDGPSPSERFAVAAGARPVLEEVRRALDLTALDDAALGRLRADAAGHADGYELVQWVDRAPDDVAAEVARLKGRMSTDVPLGEMDWQAEKWDVERLREQERITAARGRALLVTVARHTASGRLAALTDIGVNRARPLIAYQWDTIVDPEHRGRRLGTLVKLANLGLLRAEVPGARSVQTWNAAVNDHMVAINEALGFRPVSREIEWQLEL